MSKKIVIDPVTRIEGHAKITITMNDSGEVDDAQFHVTQFRGFEKLAEGRPFREMPSLMARICGICPVSHLIASAKACDEIVAVRIPATAIKLRKILNIAQIIQSHALSFFYLSAPDLLLGMDSDPDKRNIFGLLEADPAFARGGVRMRQFGQEVIEILAGKRIHPSWVVPGGVSDPLTEERRDKIVERIPEVKAFAVETLEKYLALLDNFRDEIRVFASFPTLYAGLVTPDNGLEFYDGAFKLVDTEGEVVNPGIPPYKYKEFLGEAVEDYSYLKSPYYKPMGYPDGMYRVGPLARLNIVDHCGTPLADEALKVFQELEPEERSSSFHYHYTRLIEVINGIEQIENFLNEEDILSDHVLAVAAPNQYEGVGISEAPRGTLLHHYRINSDGLIEWANLIIATGNNNLAMNRGVKDVAKTYIKGPNINEGALNRVEAVIRTFDPCLSCSTHAVGEMPMHITLRGPDGEVLDEVRR